MKKIKKFQLFVVVDDKIFSVAAGQTVKVLASGGVELELQISGSHHLFYPVCPLGEPEKTEYRSVQSVLVTWMWPDGMGGEHVVYDHVPPYGLAHRLGWVAVFPSEEEAKSFLREKERFGG